MASIEDFKHSPLSAATSYRLVRFVELSSEGFARFQVSEHQPGFLPCFSALSYHWGNGPTLHTIFLNGKRFQVRWNLWSFLEQLYLDRDYSYYWIDAMCINRDDPLERNESVLRVGYMYSHAQKVVVWLGNHESLELCFKELELSRMPTYLSEEDEAARSIARSGLCSAILKMRYWTRAWVIQEIMVARTVVLRCRSQYISIEYLYQYCLMHMIEQPSIWRLERSWTLLHNLELRRTLSWADWLHFIADQECADPRDKAYSFLGLYTRRFNKSKPLVSANIDYRKDVATVYWDCVYTLLSEAKDASYEVVKQRALTLRQWIEKVLGLTPIEAVTDKSESCLSLLEAYISDETVSTKHQYMARVTWIVSMAFGLAWAAASTFLPFKTIMFICVNDHVHTDIQGAAMLVPSDHAAEGSPIYNHLTTLAQSCSTAEWQCSSCSRIVGDFFLSKNQLEDERVERIPTRSINDKGKTKVLPRLELSQYSSQNYPWHEKIANCSDCSFIEFTIVRHLRAACTRRMWESVPIYTEQGPKSPDHSNGYDTLFSPEDAYFYYQAAHTMHSVLVLWIKPGTKVSVSHTTDDLQRKPEYIWFTATRPETEAGCWIRVCSSRVRPTGDPTWGNAWTENTEETVRDTEKVSSSGTDGALSLYSEEDLAERSEKDLPAKTQEVLSNQSGSSLPEESREPLSEEINSAFSTGVGEPAPSKQVSSMVKEDPLLAEEGEAADSEDQVLYNDKIATWLTKPPAPPDQKFRMPLVSQARPPRTELPLLPPKYHRKHGSNKLGGTITGSQDIA